MTHETITIGGEEHRMHYRQVAVLREVPEESRRAVLSHAHFLMNISGGNLSGNLWNAVQDWKRLGSSAEALITDDKEMNEKLMRRDTAWR